MNAVAFDANRFDRHLARFERRLPLIDDLPLAKITVKLRERFGKIDEPRIDKDRINDAARQAVRDCTKLRPGQRLLLAFALAQPTATLRGKCLFERETVLDTLLRQWERDAHRDTLRLSHWKGLFHSYMQAPAGLIQQRLGRLLKNGLESAIRVRRHPPAWLDGFRRHEQLLGRDPCAPYLDDLMAGRSDRLQDLTEHAGVSIPPTSWFWQELNAALLMRIAHMGKADFLASLVTFIGMDKLFPPATLATDGLIKALLERYEACGDQAKHPRLMAFALDTWGSPQLDSNVAWNQCSKPARQMVCRWIAKEDLEQFYRLCKGDQDVDEARLEFWLRFQKQMVYTQILLGSGMRNSVDADIRKFVEDRSRQGRLGSLTGSQSSNNAMLMQIGKWVFVEFSKIGTACRCIRLADGEFETGQSAYPLGSLRHTGEQWVHMPSGSWQPKFLRELAAKDILPDDGEQTAPHVFPWSNKKPTAGRRSGPDLAKLKALGILVRDRRPQGGALWVYPRARTSGATQADLAAMGFRYAKVKGAWYYE